MRATGKTYRAILRAVADASEGKNIILVTLSPDTAFKMVYQIVQGLDCVALSNVGRTLKFKNAGALKIITNDNFLIEEREGRWHGIRYEKVFDVWEGNARVVRKK